MSISLPDALEKLFRRTAFGIKPGLEVTEAILAELGNPHRKIPCVHVAGTNGKGSVAAMVESVLRAAGIRTAFYTSPHLVRFNERFRIAGQPIADEELAALLENSDAAADAVSQKHGLRPATFFEIATALAFEYFARQNAEISVIETGMGGTWDSTNVITPLVSVITRIGMDHMEYLGSTLEKIAGEKSGIIKPGVPVVFGKMPEEASAVILRRAKELGAPAVDAAQYASVRRMNQDLDGQRISIETQQGSCPPVLLPLLGDHQLENTAIAVAALETLADRLGTDIPPEVIKKGLEKTFWPARCQILSREPPVILDGAHNTDGGEALARTLKSLKGKRPLRLVVSFLADKDADGFLKHFSRMAEHAWAVQLHGERARPVADIVSVLRRHQIPCETAALPEALASAKKWAAENGGMVCITGSLYLAGEVLELEQGRLNFI
ncbi:MAG: folylpolyglutamate synthase/dihydrofolate synthase family protein [Kiritimatiellia bacterium]